MRWWWLSFCDTSRPEGSQFSGACLIWASDLVLASHVARSLGLNPGGEVLGALAPEGWDPHPKWLGRLLTREECKAFDAENAPSWP